MCYPHNPKYATHLFADAALVKDAYYTSPDHLRLREALICGGGETEIKVVKKCKTMTFYEL